MIQRELPNLEATMELAYVYIDIHKLIETAQAQQAGMSLASSPTHFVIGFTVRLHSGVASGAE